MKILDDYLKLQKEIYAFFGYKEEYVVLPLKDAREFFWHLTGESLNDYVKFAEKKENVFNGTNTDGYEERLCDDWFLSKLVYRGKDFTMICTDTRAYGNEFLRIFDNTKEIKDTPTQKNREK